MRLLSSILSLGLFAGFALSANAVGNDLFNNTGYMEGLSGAIPMGSYGASTTPEWRWDDYEAGASGATFTVDDTQSHSSNPTGVYPSTGKSLKWTLPAGYDHFGMETNYFEAVAAVPGGTGSYVLSGWIRQEGHTDNFVGGPGLASGGPTDGGAGGEQFAVQWSDGTTVGGQFSERLTQLGYAGHAHLTGAPVWEGFGERFTLPTAGPFNAAGTYLGLGIEHMNPTQTTNGMSTWLDDLLCVKAGDDTASGNNIILGGSFEAMTGAIPAGGFGASPAGWYWGNYAGTNSSAVIDTAEHNNGAKSLKWQIDTGQTSISGDELYYQNTVASIAAGEYVFSGYMRQSGKASNYDGTGTTAAPQGWNAGGGLVQAIQINTTGGAAFEFGDQTDLGYVGDKAGNAVTGLGSPAWKGFAKTFLINAATAAGPFNDAPGAHYCSLGWWRANPTSTADGPIITWVDDVECRPRDLTLLPVELSSVEID